MTNAAHTAVGPARETPSAITAADHDRAFEFFNQVLFGGALQRPVITLSSRKKAMGYFRSGFFRDERGQGADEIGLNPEYYSTLQDYLSTLVHEQAHQWQFQFGKPGKNGYHNKAWVEKMTELGLPPFNTKDPAKQTGTTVSHRVEPEGRFAVACAQLLRSGFTLRWTKSEPDEDVTELSPEQIEDLAAEAEEKRRRREAQRRSKTPYHCPVCLTKAWAKPKVKLMCGECWAVLVPSDEVVAVINES